MHGFRTSGVAMSAEAMAAFKRVQIRPRLDGTAMFCALHLCIRHDKKKDAAWQSLAKMALELDLPKRTLIDAIDRLENAGFVQRVTGGGRGRATRYRLPFLAIYRLDPKSKEAIILRDPHRKKRRGPPHRSRGERVRLSTINSAAERNNTVRLTAHEKKKTIKHPETPPEKGDERHDTRTPAERAFDELHNRSTGRE